MYTFSWEPADECLEWLCKCQSAAQDDESGARLDTYLADFNRWRGKFEADLHTISESQPVYCMVVKKVFTLFYQFLWNYAKLVRDTQGTDDALRNVDSAIENLASMRQNEIRDRIGEFFATQGDLVTDMVYYEPAMHKQLVDPLNNLLPALQEARDQALLSYASHNTMTEGIDEETMIRSLRNATMFDLVDSRPFIPHEKLLEICNEQAVTKELARVFPENDPNTNERLTLSICHGQIKGPYMTTNSCHKTFAVLVLIQQARAIELFLRHRFCDDDLPLHNTSDFPVLQSSREGPGNEVHLSDGFNQYELINNFIDKQWLVLPPDLKKGKMSSAPFPQAREHTFNDLWDKHRCDIITSTRSKWHKFSRWICTQCHGISAKISRPFKNNTIYLQQTTPKISTESISESSQTTLLHFKRR
ncbi:hypothetical protein J3E69DRAFT_346572 [Trichoderma sp. SZMC 28015]